MRILGIIALCAALAGCAGGAGVGETDRTQSTVVQRPYQEVYRDARQYAKECFQAGLITAEMKVDADLFTDIKRGEIRIYLMGALGKQDQFEVDIEAQSKDGAKLTVRQSSRVLVTATSQMENFLKTAQGQHPIC
jgi:outer membrane biogenesis lipoprotein LolB